MRITALIGQLETALQNNGDIEVELQEKNTDCFRDFHSIVENTDRGRVLKLRSWPY